MATEYLLELPVRFGSKVSLGDTVSLGFKVERAHTTAKVMDDYFSGCRLEVQIGTAFGGSPKEQQALWNDMQEKIAAVADVRSYHGSQDGWSATMVFNRKDVDGGQSLDVFRKRAGALRVVRRVAMPKVDTPSRAEREESKAKAVAANKRKRKEQAKKDRPKPKPKLKGGLDGQQPLKFPETKGRKRGKEAAVAN